MEKLMDSSREWAALTDQYESTTEPNPWYQEKQLCYIAETTRRIIDLQNMLKHSYTCSPAIKRSGINSARLEKLMEFREQINKIESAISVLISQEFKAKVE